MAKKVAPERTPRGPLIRRRWQVSEIILMTLLGAMPFVLALFAMPWAVTIIVFLLCQAAIVGLVLLRGEWGVVGPHFFYDIIRLARRGRSTGIRILFVLVLMLALGYVYWARNEARGRPPNQSILAMLFDPGPGTSYNAMANLAEAYVFSIIIVQNLAVLLLTPAYVASSVAEERERRTLEMLFTSHLHNREIVLGKLGARAMHMFGVLLAGLPILSLSQLLGGVDMGVLVANFVNTALNLMTVGSICILVSTLSRTVFAAVMISYGILLPFALCFSCFSMNQMSSLLVLWQRDFGGSSAGLLESMAALVLFHGLVSATCLAVAISSLRAPLESDMILQRQAAAEHRPRRRREMLESREEPLEKQIVKRDRLKPLPPLDERPLLWKEMYLGGQIIVFSPAFWVPLGSLLIPLLVMFLFMLLDLDRNRSGPMEGFNVILRFLLVLLAGLFCLGVGHRACGSVVREKQQGTLDSLLMLPVTGREILYAKWLGCLYKGWGWSIFYVPIVLFGVATGVLHVVGGTILIIAPLVHGVFLASLGLFLSVVSRTVLAAQMKLVLGLVAVLAVGIVGSLAVGNGFEGMQFFNVALNPFVSWYQLGFAPWEWREPFRGDQITVRFVQAVIGLLLYAAAAMVFWLAACRAFRSERFRGGD